MALAPLPGLWLALRAQSGGGKPPTTTRSLLVEASFRTLYLEQVISFVSFPFVSSTAFAAFECEEIAPNRFFLRADYSIACDSPEHAGIAAVASSLITLHAFIIPLGFLALLVYSPSRRNNNNDHRLSRAMSFLYGPFAEHSYAWEFVETGKKLLLVGFARVMFTPGSLARLLIAVLVSLGSLTFLTLRRPYRSTLDNYLGTAVSFSLSCFLLLCIGLEMGDFVEELSGSGVSPEYRELFDFHSVLMTFLTGLFALSGVGLLVTCLIFELRRAAFFVSYRGRRVQMSRVLRSFVRATPAHEQELLKFTGNKMTMGKPSNAALGLGEALGLSNKALFSRVALGMEAIEAEWEQHGTPVDIECFRYVRYGKAGSIKKVWHNGKMMDHLGDKEEDPASWAVDPSRDGWELKDFAAHESACIAKLDMAHVCALRLYTCSNYSSLNDPLRGMGNKPGHFFDSSGLFHGSWEPEQPDGSKPTPRDFEGKAYPFPTTLWYLTDAIKRLRAVGYQSSANQAMDLYRGMKNLTVTDEFVAGGGSEAAPMSTTSDLDIALGYSALGERRLFFKLATSGFMERGASLRWVSAFPDEDECLFPPLTYLQPTGRRETVNVSQHGARGKETVEFDVIEVTPHFAS
mmetsp:Transcript_37842/g.110855  ORF Transcript_37842/g.110855 Transcript_37842/m.110855 type:complete len:631 (-) Transcript_37842:426-2318(-)